MCYGTTIYSEENPRDPVEDLLELFVLTRKQQQQQHIWRMIYLVFWVVRLHHWKHKKQNMLRIKWKKKCNKNSYNIQYSLHQTRSALLIYVLVQQLQRFLGGWILFLWFSTNHCWQENYKQPVRHEIHNNTVRQRAAHSAKADIYSNVPHSFVQTQRDVTEPILQEESTLEQWWVENDAIKRKKTFVVF